MFCRRRFSCRPLFPFFLNIQEQNRVYLSTLCNKQHAAKTKILTLAKADQLDEAHALIGQLSTKLSAYQAYNQLIKAHARHCHDPIRQHKALQLVQEMKTAGLVPSNQTYFQLLLGMTYNKEKDLLPFFYEYLKLESLKNYKRTGSKLKKIINSMSSQGHPQLKELLIYINEHCFELDKHIYTDAISECTIDLHLQTAEDLLNYARLKGKAEVDAYDVLIRAYLTRRQDLKSASQIFSIMSKDGLDATASIYSAFIETYINEPLLEKHENNNNSLRIETVRQLWQAMMLIKRKEENRDDVPSIRLIAHILGYYRRHGALSDAEQLYLDISKILHIKLDRAAEGEMNRLILAFTKRNQMPSALSLYYDLLGSGHYKPSLCLMQTMIRQLCQKGDKETAQQLIQVTAETLNKHLPNYTLNTCSLEEIIIDYNNKSVK